MRCKEGKYLSLTLVISRVMGRIQYPLERIFIYLHWLSEGYCQHYSIRFGRRFEKSCLSLPLELSYAWLWKGEGLPSYLLLTDRNWPCCSQIHIRNWLYFHNYVDLFVEEIVLTGLGCPKTVAFKMWSSRFQLPKSLIFDNVGGGFWELESTTSRRPEDETRCLKKECF